VQYAWLGVGLQTVTPEVARAASLITQSGSLVTIVYPDTPAAKAGIKGGSKTVAVGDRQLSVGGDVITAADGRPIASSEELIAFLSTKNPGDTVTITIERNGKTQDVTATLAARPADL